MLALTSVFHLAFLQVELNLIQQISTASFTLKESFQYTNKKTHNKLNNKCLNPQTLKTENKYWKIFKLLFFLTR